MEFKKYKMWKKVDTRQTIKIKAFWVWLRFCIQKKQWLFQKANVAKIMVNVQKNLKGGSVKAHFQHGENIDHAEKNSSNYRL